MQKDLGLSTQEAEASLEKYGLNDVVENNVGIIKKFLSPLYSPISIMLLVAAFLSFLNGQLFDFYFIFALYIVNYSVQKWQEFKADKAIHELREKLSFDVWTLRDGRWIFINAKHLTLGDHIRLGLGGIIPADAIVISSANLSVNEAVLTGESMPKEKKTGDKIYSGSFIATGNLEAEITAVGKNTNFGKTIFSIEQPADKSILEKDILSITRFLMIISILSVLILTIVFILKGFNIEGLIMLDLSLIIAGVPIALPAVMAIILSIGAAGLAKKQVVVRRLSALQDLANVNLLLTDKTGTLTKNEIRVANVISYQKGLSTNDVVNLAHYAISSNTPDAIDLAIIKKFEEADGNLVKAELINFIPYDSERKRSTAIIQKGQEKILVSMGAPQVIMSLDEFSSKEMAERFEKDIMDAASNGFRVLAVASRRDGLEEKHMKIAGLLLLADPLDETSKETIGFMKDNGIGVRILTGDNKVISERIARELGIDSSSVFAEILPKDKYEIVKSFKEKYIVAVTGDGVNDLPAIKVANVGIAVSGAVSALKSLADIVLLGSGISVIKDAILESRKIFVRLYNYSVYRISESFRLIITILILGLWFGFYPLQPLQLILLAFLNDIPIVSLAYDRVKISAKPSEIKSKQRLGLSLLFGSIGVLNSILLFLIMTNIFHLPLSIIQTIFFLKLTVGGHALIYVAHTKERWFKFLPSKQVIIATLATQFVATTLAVTGFLMPARISISYAILVWVWALIWMQISEMMKDLQNRLIFIK